MSEHHDGNHTRPTRATHHHLDVLVAEGLEAMWARIEQLCPGLQAGEAQAVDTPPALEDELRLAIVLRCIT